MDFFFGRDREKKLLEELYNSDRAEFVAVYGRRRVGKTYLINEFFKDKGIYFEVTGSKKAPKAEQLSNFFREFSESFPDEEKIERPKDWGEALYWLKDAIAKIPVTQKVILFFDELPWLASRRSGFLQALDYFWNRHASRMKNVKLIVCGSAAAWMIHHIIDDKGGLYGRLSQQIRLEPFSLTEVENLLFFKGIKLDRKQLISLYMTIGGIPKYLNFIKPGMSVAQMLNEFCFKPQGFLFQEFAKLFKSLFDGAEKHIKVVKVLAQHRYGLEQPELFVKAGLSKGGHSSAVLEELEESGFIMSIPQYEKAVKERKWRLADEYSYFYLTWVENIRSLILRKSEPEYWMKQQENPKWLTWAGYAFENICLKHVAKIKAALGLAGITTIDTQWFYRGDKTNEGAQIDLVLDRADSCINLCEIKFSQGIYVLTKKDQEDLERKRRVFQQKTETRKTIFMTLITPYGVEENSYYLSTVQKQLTMNDLF
jgi:predicted AAA+ superfamily ATPase